MNNLKKMRIRRSEIATEIPLLEATASGAKSKICRALIDGGDAAVAQSAFEQAHKSLATSRSALNLIDEEIDLEERRLANIDVPDRLGDIKSHLTARAKLFKQRIKLLNELRINLSDSGNATEHAHIGAAKLGQQVGLRDVFVSFREDATQAAVSARLIDYELSLIDLQKRRDANSINQFERLVGETTAKSTEEQRKKLALVEKELAALQLKLSDLHPAFEERFRSQSPEHQRELCNQIDALNAQRNRLLSGKDG
jgi:hypothetical protein